MGEILYTSDSHLDHKNIIRYTNRPYYSVDEMNTDLIRNLRVAEQAGGHIIHAGDLTFDLEEVHHKYGQIFEYPERHTYVVGNHDNTKKYRSHYEREFGQIVGTEKTWFENAVEVVDSFRGIPSRILISHNPIRKLPDTVLFNVYGHVHNNLEHSMPYHIDKYGREWVEWLATSERHLNASVELTGFKPVNLYELMRVNNEHQAKLQAQLATL